MQDFFTALFMEFIILLMKIENPLFFYTIYTCSTLNSNHGSKSRISLINKTNNIPAQKSRDLNDGRRNPRLYYEIKFANVCLSSIPIFWKLLFGYECTILPPPTTTAATTTTTSGPITTTTTSPTCSTTTTAATTTTMAPTSDFCESFSDIRDCVKNGCDYSHKEKLCSSNENFCRTISKDPLECIRRGSLYAVAGGVLCEVDFSSAPKYCLVEEELWTVNFGSEWAFPDSKNVLHLRQDDSYDYTAFVVGNQTATSEYMEDVALYSTYIEEKIPRRIMDTNCLQNNITVNSDGYYELAIKVADPVFSIPYKRVFHVNIYGLKEFIHIDPGRWTGRRGYGREYIVNFKITDNLTKIVIKDMKPINLVYNKFSVELCHGTNPNSPFVVSALSVVRFKTFTLPMF